MYEPDVFLLNHLSTSPKESPKESFGPSDTPMVLPRRGEVVTCG
jgi:hypothetical protein